MSELHAISSEVAGPAVKNSASLERALQGQRNFHHVKLGSLLLQQGVVTREQLNRAIELQRQFPQRKLGDILADHGAVSLEQIHLAVARSLGAPVVELDDFDFDSRALACVPADLARTHQLMPLMLYGEHLVVAIENLLDADALSELGFVAERNIVPVYAGRREIEQAINQHYSNTEAERELAERQLEDFYYEDDQALWREAERLANEAPIVKMVNNIILDAVRQRASDVHIRPCGKHVELLFRIDGALVAKRNLKKSLLPAIVSRIKILSRLNIAEHRLPQDGRSRIQDGANIIDLRISIIPCQFGENIVIRILNKGEGLRALNEIGFGAHDEALFSNLINKSYGILLVTGPTGSGKTTTLYAALREVMRRNLNIVTVEDPVEYEIEGISQIQALPAIHFGFPQALRHILRHDPDVIMIGEIRDQETCKIALESALTGHLVLSTLHTNDAPGAITRLMEMGVESYLLKSAIIGVLAQRLVRRNCPHCLAEEEADPMVRRALGVGDDEVSFKGRGCEHCHHTGYYGRLAVYELLVVNETMRSAILPGTSASDLRQIALQNGMVPLSVNAIEQARRHNTSLAEVYRVSMETI